MMDEELYNQCISEIEKNENESNMVYFPELDIIVEVNNV